MLITKSIKPFIVFREDSILDSLKKIDENKQGTVFVLDYNGYLEGVVTDGDFRRWLTSHKTYDLSDSVSEIMNSKFTAHKIDDAHSKINTALSGHIKIIPLLNVRGQLIAVAISQNLGVEIGGHIISEDTPCFVIAEVGNNHNGDIKLAKQLVDLAIESGADCVKFQMRNIKELFKNEGKHNDKSTDLGMQYTLDLLNRFQLSNDELIEVFDYCKIKGTIPLCTPWDSDSFFVLKNYGMIAYKVASADLTNSELLKEISETGNPILCSTGMSTEAEIKCAVNILRKYGAQFILLHCNSTYPTPYRDVNLNYLANLRKITGTPVGYSGHERGFIVPVLAVALGAKVIEKHFTIDKDMEGNDHKVSLLPTEFRKMVDQIRLTEEIMGSCEKRVISQGESMNREILAKSLVTNQSIASGTVITREMINIKSPGQGLQPYQLDNLVGKKARRNFLSGDYFFESDLNGLLIIPRAYSFKRPFGIPVRYHDYENIISDTNVDFVEFHLSYKDLEINVDDVFSGTQEIGLAVHCPELFSGDHILNLCSEDDKYRERSITELQNVIKITHKLKKYFPASSMPFLVTNVGGFSTTKFLPKERRREMYDKVADALDQLDSDGVEIVIQTMPPFPWHFGGQSYHNLFVDPDEIASFCTRTGNRICFDVSHSQMACNYYQWSLEDFIYKIVNHIAYLHVVDALGIDGEGVQIGKGDVDFVLLSKKLDELAPDVAFIPEVWQGHKENGNGFWVALEFLEGYL